MRRKLFTLAAGVSAVLCASVCVLWVRSYKRPERFSSVCGGNRYTLVATRGRLTLYGPPSGPRSAADPPDAADLVARLRNDDVTWYALLGEDWPKPQYIDGPGVVRLRLEYPGAALESPGLGRGVVRLLLGALDRPEAFVAAHVLLTHQFEPPPRRWHDGRGAWLWSEVPDPAIPYRQPSIRARREARGNYYGLRVKLWLTDDDDKRMFSGGVPFPCSTWADPEQRDAIRERWHLRLDVPVQSAPCWGLVALTAAGPLLWVVTGVRRRRTHRSRLSANYCPACGYDLRATPGRCPECGAVPAAKGAAA